MISRIPLLAFLICLTSLPLAQNGRAITETYLIDDLIIKTTDLSDHNCATGGYHSILVSGSIGPDSTFATRKLMDQRKPCASLNGDIIRPIKVILESEGGYLEDGYKLGILFRERGVTTVIEENKMCASSCAVAFLGGEKRIVASTGSILFHAPYLKQMELDGRDKITCKLPKEELQGLNDYYNKMTSIEVGDRLFERTMSYCSTENGWTIKGGPAAQLYEIATHKKAIDSPVIYCWLASAPHGLKAYESSECPSGTIPY